jgi:hypothetical protein
MERLCVKTETKEGKCTFCRFRSVAALEHKGGLWKIHGENGMYGCNMKAIAVNETYNKSDSVNSVTEGQITQ